ncbi:hypothetical protein C8R43DRAFT_1042491 [Mycena crocata]|nr:hypothetical protein C8R43DRAFT_1042491 [Mycena crocata]
MIWGVSVAIFVILLWVVFLLEFRTLSIFSFVFSLRIRVSIFPFSFVVVVLLL